MYGFIRSTMIFLLAPLLLAGCGTYRWAEDVKLSDGRVVTVERIQKYSGGGGIGDTCFHCVLDKAEMRFSIDGKSYKWVSNQFSFEPMILDIVGDSPVLVALPPRGLCTRDPENYDHYYLYTYNIWDGGRWTENTSFYKPIMTTRNLINARPDRRHVSIEDKRLIIDPSRMSEHEYRIIKKYRKIDADNFIFVPEGCSPWGIGDEKDLKRRQKDLIIKSNKDSFGK